MKQQVELKLIKTVNGISVLNENDGLIAIFDESDAARKEFVMFLIENFINQPVSGGKEYR